MKIMDIFDRIKGNTTKDDRPLLQKLVDIVKNGSVEKAILLLNPPKKWIEPVATPAIPYTSEAIRMDFSAVRQCMAFEQLTDDELAALLAVVMMKKHPKSISQLLLSSGYTSPPIDRVIYLETYVNTEISLAQLSSVGIKKYRISSCGDERVCPKCAKHDGKKHFVAKAMIGKNAPPFCEKCRCIIRPVY